MKPRTGFLFGMLLFLLSGMALAASSFSVSPNGVQYKDLHAGSGPVAEQGDIVRVHFVGWLDEENQKGKELFNTRNRGKPAAFVVGTEKVMPAWNDGVIGMQVGGKRLLMVPPKLGYGSKGVQDVVPPDASLIFLFELVDLQKAGD
ncbi:MAG: FKBP-type peptidyl-prolyl cis-trans isomerase [Gammaproteobacteria bacterium]